MKTIAAIFASSVLFMSFFGEQPVGVRFVHIENESVGAVGADGEYEYKKRNCELNPQSRKCVRWCIGRGGCYDIVPIK